MNKGYFQFKEQYIKEEEGKEEKPSNTDLGRTKDEVNTAFDKAVKEAERKSKAEDRIYGVYQDRVLRPERFKVQLVADQSNLEFWNLVGQTDHNGDFQKTGTILYDLGEAVLDEKLSITGRRALKRSAKKNKSRLKIARKRAKRKVAPTKKIMARAQRRARKKIAAHLTSGRGTSGMSHAQLNKLQTMVNARHGQLDQLRRQLIPQTRKDDRKK